MPNNEYVLTMAKYNLWQNESLIKAASSLNDENRRLDRGAFFGSIERTFSHILWGDRMWLSRFTGTKAPAGAIPESTENIHKWNNFRVERASFDKSILEWAHTVQPSWFDGDLSWFSDGVGRDMTKPKSMLVTHMFNHQTHHRGQIHAMLTSAGAKPEDTDIPFMPDHYREL